eukprot:CAMPEP_0171133534 /NCGR_PEP_ID=MMETSP0766_2-20121228/126454_1 /TAXON_ID=439317 /ORGANISM="Gambierdiscus australes, Strain CAWD 149" /LENGTH=145 /DNA_ID=CAMNT_0011596923 /DNA_START=176 /DNA_END=610 /DNA_ORIENTATION=-
MTIWKASSCLPDNPCIASAGVIAVSATPPEAQGAGAAVAAAAAPRAATGDSTSWCSDVPNRLALVGGGGSGSDSLGIGVIGASCADGGPVLATATSVKGPPSALGAAIFAEAFTAVALAADDLPPKEPLGFALFVPLVALALNSW